MEIIKLLCMFLAVIYGYSNTAKIYYKQSVSGTQIVLMTIGIVGFVYIQFLM